MYSELLATRCLCVEVSFCKVTRHHRITENTKLDYEAEKATSQLPVM